MRISALVTVSAAAALAISGCQHVGAADGPDGGDADSDTDTDSDTDSESGGLTDPELPGTLRGIVTAASGFPVPYALVYVTEGGAAPIEDGAYCYECDDISGLRWTLSEADGSWEIGDVPAGAWNLVTRQGFFRRQREIEVVPDAVIDVPAELTQLPSENGADGLDRIPNYAVLLNIHDKPEDLLAKMGLGELDGEGHLQPGTEPFDLYDDDATGTSAVGPSSSLFESQEALSHYHMVFFPDICHTLFADEQTAMLQTYVSGGGAICASGWASQWVEQPFPEIVEFNGDDDLYNAGDVGEWDSLGALTDTGMGEWIEAVCPSCDQESFPFENGWTLIDSLTEGAYAGHGAEEDGTLVVPRVWATDVSEYPEHPLAVTWQYDCGRAMYTTYPGSDGLDPTPEIRPQEWVTIYLILALPGGGPCE